MHIQKCTQEKHLFKIVCIICSKSSNQYRAISEHKSGGGGPMSPIYGSLSTDFDNSEKIGINSKTL